jgi:hypothetical protein
MGNKFGSIRAKKASSKDDPPEKCTVLLDALCPNTLHASLNVWRIDDFTKKPPPKSTRFALSRATSSSSIHTFVSHTWYDKIFIDGVRLILSETKTLPMAQLADAGSKQDDKIEAMFYDLKCTGLRKGVRQLAVRKVNDVIRNVPPDVEKWNIWMDLVCIDQYNERHKAHVTGLLEDYVKESETMVVLLSPSYYSRLWCVFECCLFLAYHDVTKMAVYSWGFSDQLTVPQMANASAAVRALSSAQVDSLRAFSVDSAKCTFESDRAILRRKVEQLYTSTKAFENFARLVGIVMVSWGLILSPAVYARERYNQQIKPWISLAYDLDFVEVAEELSAFDAVKAYASFGNGVEPEKAEGYVCVVHTLFDNINVIVGKERSVALATQQA